MTELSELSPATGERIAELLERHREASRRVDWTYYDYLPLDHYAADPSLHPALSEEAYLAVETALLTEVNLPWYTSALHETYRRSLRPVHDFVRLWVAEEDQHANLLETFLLLTGNGDRSRRASVRKATVTAGWEPETVGPFEGIVYTTVQELQTRAFYIHTANVCEDQDPQLARALRRISADETLHMAFYRDAVKAHLEANPDYVLPLARVLLNFKMPSYSIPDYPERRDRLSQRVFGPEHFSDDVIEALCDYWQVDALEPSLPEARELRARLAKYRSVLRLLGKRNARAREASLTTT